LPELLISHYHLLSGATDLDYGARQAAAARELQDLKQEVEVLKDLQAKLPFGDAAWTAVQQEKAALQQRMAALQQELVPQAGECNLVLHHFLAPERQ
jgi:hypothetical protein